MSNSLLSVQNLNMQFGGIKALEQVNLAIPDNQVTAIIGPNGAGKTTLFNCITGFYKPTAGTITLNHDSDTITLNSLLGDRVILKNFFHKNYFKQNLLNIYYQWFGGAHLVNRAGIARTFQNIRLFSNMTVIENLLIAQHTNINRNIFAGLFDSKKYITSEKNAINNAYHWLKICGLEDLSNNLAGSLSYGHQRLLEIARAMCTKPKLICLDEPAAGLNSTETESLSNLIRSLCDTHNTTVVLIEHDMDLVMNISGNIYVLDHGSVIAHGTPKQIRSNPEVISAYLGQ